nr:hypothetical protein [Tanacetum cinerariifolium]
MRRIGTGFSGVETPLFDTMLVQPQVYDADEVEEDDDDKVFAASNPPSPTPTITSPPPQQEPILSPPQAQPTPLSSPPQEQPTQPADTLESLMILLNTLMETCAMPTQKGRMEEDVTALKEVNAAEPTVFDDEEVTMTMAQTLIKMKAKKEIILDVQMAKRMQEKHLDDIKKYQSLKRKPIYVAQSRKNMVVYLKNMAGYKIQYFNGMTYDQVRPIFEREYNHVQTFLKYDRYEEPTKKRVAKETMLQESFKKLRAKVEVSDSPST